MKVTLALILLAAVALARPEPPAPLYGPPSQSYNAPSSQYGPPAQSYNAPSSQYGPPSQSYNAPSSQYGPPAQGHGPSSRFGASSTHSTPSRPAARVSSRLGSGLRGSRRDGGRPSASYGAPAVTSARFVTSAPSTYASAPSSTYGAPAPSSTYGAPAPSSTYGAPAPSSTYGAPAPAPAPAPVYGPPGYDSARSRLAQDDLAEPANYEFQYAVEDDESGANFGHQEDRQDNSARGEYRVLLPDGRTQIVQYEADEEGYRPVIRYEEAGGPYPASQRNQGGPY